MESRSEAALLWTAGARNKELASRPSGPVRVRECNVALLLGPGCRAEHERPDRLYVNLVHWATAQRTKGKNVHLDDKDAAVFSTPFHHRDQDLSKHTVTHPDVGIPHEQARALEGAKHCRGAVAHLDSNVGHRGFGC